MERIAVISDIHANLAALKAVWADIERRGIGRIFCLGDLVGKGPYPAEAVDEIRQRCEVVLQGNWDHKKNVTSGKRRMGLAAVDTASARTGETRLFTESSVLLRFLLERSEGPALACFPDERV